MRRSVVWWALLLVAFVALTTITVMADVPGQATAAPNHRLDLRSSPGQFRQLFGIAVDAQGAVYVGERDTATVLKLSAAGKILARWGSKGSKPGQFSSPRGIAVDGRGNVYVADWENDCVQKFSSAGKFLARWGKKGDQTFFAANGVAVDHLGTIYVGTGGGVVKLSSTGRRLAVWQVSSAMFVHGVAIDQRGNVFTSDWDNHITKLSPSGKVLKRWASKGKGAGQVDFPEGVALDAQSNVYVADWGNDRIDKFSSAGRLLTSFGKGFGSEPGQFFGPNGVAVDTANNIYVADSVNDRIQKLSPTGKVLALWS